MKTVLFQKIQNFLDGDASPVKEDRIPRFLLLFGVIWLLLWTVWPACTVGNISIDVAENMEWGRHFQCGYDKNPYVGAWLSFWILRWIPGDWCSYLLSQLSVIFGAWAVWALGKRLFHTNFAAFLAVMLMVFNPFFSQSALEYNDDVMSISLWALTALFFFRSVKEERMTDWCLLGVFAGLAVMTKYLAAVLFLALGLLLIITPEGRKMWKKSGLYLAAVIALLIVLPNLLWLYQHDFIAFRYALMRADLTGITVSWLDHIRCPLKMSGEYLVRLIAPAAATILLFRRGPKMELSCFERWFIILNAWIPFLSLLLFSIVTGGSMRTSWFTPFYIFTGLFLVWAWNPVSSQHRLRLFLRCAAIFTVILVIVCGFEFLYKRPYLKRGCVYNAYPGREAGTLVTELWQKRYGQPLRFVIGPHTEACYTSYYSPDHPESLFNGEPELSPWINLKKVDQEGALLIFEGGDIDFSAVYRKVLPRKLEKLPPVKLRRAVPGWFRCLAGESKEVVIFLAALPPQGMGSKP